LKKPNNIIFAFLLVVFVSISMAGGVAIAQTENPEGQAVEVPEALGPDAISALVSKLDENQTQALVELIGLLNSSAGSSESLILAEGPSASEIIKAWLADFSNSLSTNVQAFPEMIVSFGSTIAAIFERRGSGTNLIFILLLALSIGAGIAAEWVFNRVTAQKRTKIRQAQPVTLMETLRTLSTRAGIEIGGVVVFTIVALIAAKIIVKDDYDLFLVSTFVVNAIVIFRIFGSVMHFLLAPRRPELRLVHTDTWTAQFIERNFILLAIFVGFTLFLAGVMQKNAIPGFDVVRFWLGLLFHVWIIVVVWRARQGLTKIIKGDDENLTPGLERMAAWWPAVSAAVVAFNWFFLQFTLSAGNDALTPQRSVTAITLVIMAPFLDTIVRGVAAHMVRAPDGKSEVAEKAYHETRLSYVRIGRIVLIGFLIMAVGKLWGVNLRNLAEAGFGAQIAANGVGFLLMLALGYLAWEITNLSINKRLATEIPEGDTGGAEGGTGLTRMATILPIMQMTLQTTIIIITVLLALSQLGVNIAPLLAGAGVLGLAIGFGAQTLVKDVVSGVFFLLDDAFRVGEFIAVGNTMGIVEKISVRSLQLRSSTGPVHIIPYGSMSQLTNNSRDWITMKLKFTVPFDTDINKVKKIFKKIGKDILEMPEHAAVLINPFKSQGAGALTDIGIVVRGKFTTVPGGQFQIRKEVYVRVQQAFKENGIEFARKEVRVHLPEHLTSADLSEAQLKAISAAASQAAEPDAPVPPKV
jgi:small-conductance mechanosensitive channel